MNTAISTFDILHAVLTKEVAYILTMSRGLPLSVEENIAINWRLGDGEM